MCWQKELLLRIPLNSQICLLITRPPTTGSRGDAPNKLFCQNGDLSGSHLCALNRCRDRVVVSMSHLVVSQQTIFGDL
jgi:hypothetical protein